MSLFGSVILLALTSVASDYPLIFKIKRNTNKNEVIYKARVQQEKKFHKDDPLEAYWLMFEEKGQREELSGIEKSLAYGFDIQEASEQQVKFEMTAVEVRDFFMKYINGVPKVISQYQGKDYHLNYIYVHAEPGLILPSVTRVELHGNWAHDGKPMVEIIRQ